MVVKYNKNEMNMFIFQQFFVTLAIAIFVVNAVNEELIKECRAELTKLGRFNWKWDKTEAFMHAFYKLNITLKRNHKGATHDYQKELWDKFIEAHENHIAFMFEPPEVWCENNKYLHLSKGHIIDDKFCKDAMNNYRVPNLIESRKAALEGIFLNLRRNSGRKYIKVMQKFYIDYVGLRIKDYVKYTSARSPLEYCYELESNPKKIIILNSIGKFEEIENPKYIRPSYSVRQKITFQPNYNSQLASSSDAVKSIRKFDLNEIPSDKDE